MFRLNIFKKIIYLVFVQIFFVSPALSADPVSLIEKSTELDLANHPVWKALLHFKGQSPTIADPNFYLSKLQPNLENELIESIKVFSNTADKNEVCLFPARFLWLKSKIDLPEFDFSKCANLAEFVSRAPLNKVKLVFASENISQPSSMMGHVFFKISGTNHSGIQVDHALSFFTDIDGNNFIKLAFESLVTGKNGYYSLSPYNLVQNNYLFVENRNIWEYEIPLSEFERKLLHFHFYEMKNIRFNYFFHTYNCATLVFDTLAVVNENLSKDRSLWLSPLDVVRSADGNHLTGETTFFPTSRWKIKALQNEFDIPSEEVRSIKNQEFEKINCSDNSLKANPGCELAKSYNDYLLETEEINTDAWRENGKKLSVNKAKLDFTNYKKPVSTISDSQLSLGYSSSSVASSYMSDSLFIGYLPASHTLDDDNAQYLSESELKIFEMFLNYELKSKILSVKTLTLYSAVALNPVDSLIGGLSGVLRLGIEPQYNQLMTERIVGFIEGGAGKTYNLHKDMIFYVMPQLGFSFNEQINYFYGKPEIGIIVRGVFNLKSNVSYGYHWNEFESQKSYQYVQLIESLNRKNWGLSLKWRHSASENTYADDTSVSFKYLF